MRRAREIYAEYPECVNICTFAQPLYSLFLSGNVEYLKPNLAFLRDYGLTDSGLYDLERWRRLDMRFLDSEKAHAKKYLMQGLRVFFHPLPTVAPIPWPAVVRSGRVRGREVQSTQQFLLRPLTPSETSQVKEATEPIPLEDLAVPWGWTCLTPYWVTDLRTINYWVYLYRDMREPWPARGVAAMGTTRPAQCRLAAPSPETAEVRVVAGYSSASLACFAPQANCSAHSVVDPADNSRPAGSCSGRSKDATYLRLLESFPGSDGMS